jgi:pyruvate dehydrogenase E2 component (dihydrolipoamide acetyltransferase)
MSRTDFLLPDLGEGMEQAEVIQWLIQPGGAVTEHQGLVEVQTDKALVELTSPVTGVLVEHGAAEGGTLTLNGLVATFEVESAGSTQLVVPAGPTPKPGNPSPDGVAPGGPCKPPRRPLAAPTVRKLASDRGIDLAHVIGTGPGGRLTREDIDRATAGEPVQQTGPETTPDDSVDAHRIRPSDSSADSSRKPLRGLRRAISQKMTQTLRTVPHVTGMLEVDVTRLEELLTDLRPVAEAEGVHLTWGAFFAAATVQALSRFPHFNASIDMEREEIVVHHRVHLGIATATPDGLVVPVVRDADRLSWLELATEIARVSRSARDRTARPEYLTGSTFTLSNYGAVGGWFGTPMVNAPEVGIVGFGRVEQRPVVQDGQVVVRTMTALSHTVDHRLIDGADNAAFGDEIRSRLADPRRLMLGARRGDG